MKVILLVDVKGQGNAGDVVEVSDGHARNYLIPRKLAKEATKKGMTELKQQEAKRARQKEREIAEAKAIQEKLQGIIVNVTARGGEGGKLFGSVTGKEIVEALEEQHGIRIEKNKLVDGDPIRSFGSYEVKVKLGHETSGVINLMVVGK